MMEYKLSVIFYAFRITNVARTLIFQQTVNADIEISKADYLIISAAFLTMYGIYPSMKKK